VGSPGVHRSRSNQSKVRLLSAIRGTSAVYGEEPSSFNCLLRIRLDPDQSTMITRDPSRMKYNPGDGLLATLPPRSYRSSFLCSASALRRIKGSSGESVGRERAFFGPGTGVVDVGEEPSEIGARGPWKSFRDLRRCRRSSDGDEPSSASSLDCPGGTIVIRSES
jgi:hypothetical protein